MKHLRSVATTATALLIGVLASNAHAADPIKKGTLALGAERLMGLSHTSASIGDVDTKQTQFTIMAQGAHGPWDLPRVGFDGFITNGLSIGGTLGIMYSSTTVKVNGPAGTSFSGDGSETDILFAPRVGYAVMLSDSIGIWPRGGLSYYHLSVNPNGNAPDTTGHYIGLNLECPFLFFPSPAFAITVTPLLDLSLDGSRSVQNGNVTTTLDASYTSFGVFAGMVAFF